MKQLQNEITALETRLASLQAQEKEAAATAALASAALVDGTGDAAAVAAATACHTPLEAAISTVTAQIATKRRELAQAVAAEQRAQIEGQAVTIAQRGQAHAREFWSALREADEVLQACIRRAVLAGEGMEKEQTAFLQMVREMAGGNEWGDPNYHDRHSAVLARLAKAGGSVESLGDASNFKNSPHLSGLIFSAQLRDALRKIEGEGRTSYVSTGADSTVVSNETTSIVSSDQVPYPQVTRR